MSDHIQKKAVSPLGVEPPLAPPDHLAVGDAARPPFPWTMGAAGALWLLASALLFLLVPPLAYGAWPALQYLLHGNAYPLDLLILSVSSMLALVAALGGAAFLRGGIRVIRGTATATSAKRLGIGSILASPLLSALGWRVMLSEGIFYIFYIFHMAGVDIDSAYGVEAYFWLPLVYGCGTGCLLLTAGVLALAGKSQYELWRKARELGRERDGGNTGNPFRK